MWLLTEGWSAAQVADALERDPHTIGEWLATFDKLGGFKTDVAKKLVRVTMQAALDPGTGPIPGWPKNGGRIWNAWNDSYGTSP